MMLLPSQTTYRRLLLDQMLEKFTPMLRGLVLDVGGKRELKRGSFRGGDDENRRWVYLNIATETRPHVLADAHKLPLAPGSVDAVLCCEVLEHVVDPRQCCAEILDVLKPGGTFMFSVPFLYPVHADPHDYTRFTADGVQLLCRDFESVQVEPMGSWLGTVGLLLDLGARKLSGSFGRVLFRRILRMAGRLLCQLDARGVTPVLAFSTGYFCIATKRGESEYHPPANRSHERREAT